MGERDKSDRTEFCLKRGHRTIEDRPGGAHQGAEHSPMRGSLMMGMVPGMLNRLRLSQSADGKNTEHQKNRQEFEDSAVHEHSPECNWVEC